MQQGRILILISLVASIFATSKAQSGKCSPLDSLQQAFMDKKYRLKNDGKPLPPPSAKDMDKCTSKNIYIPAVNRMTVFPFCTATSVKLIVYDVSKKSYYCENMETLVAKDSLLLDMNQCFEITDILYNYRAKGLQSIYETMPFAPKYGLLFYKQDKLIDYLLVNNDSYQSYSYTTNWGVSCEKKILRLCSLFKMYFDNKE